MQDLAKQIQAQGRGNDTVLVHMTPREVGGLQALAKAAGGSLTVNPKTGLPEAGFLDSLLPVLAGAAGGALGVDPWIAGLGAAGVQTAITGSLGQGLTAGLGAYGGATLGNMVAGVNSNDLLSSKLSPTTPSTTASTMANLPASGGAPTSMSYGGQGTGYDSLGFTSTGGYSPSAAAKPGLIDQFTAASTAGMGNSAGNFAKYAPWAAALGVASPLFSTGSQGIPYDPTASTAVDPTYKGPYTPVKRKVISNPNAATSSVEHLYFEDLNPYGVVSAATGGLVAMADGGVTASTAPELYNAPVQGKSYHDTLNSTPRTGADYLSQMQDFTTKSAPARDYTFHPQTSVNTGEKNFNFTAPAGVNLGDTSSSSTLNGGGGGGGDYVGSGLIDVGSPNYGEPGNPSYSSGYTGYDSTGYNSLGNYNSNYDASGNAAPAPTDLSYGGYDSGYDATGYDSNGNYNAKYDTFGHSGPYSSGSGSSGGLGLGGLGSNIGNFVRGLSNPVSPITAGQVGQGIVNGMQFVPGVGWIASGIDALALGTNAIPHPDTNTNTGVAAATSPGTPTNMLANGVNYVWRNVFGGQPMDTSTPTPDTSAPSPSLDTTYGGSGTGYDATGYDSNGNYNAAYDASGNANPSPDNSSPDNSSPSPDANYGGYGDSGGYTPGSTGFGDSISYDNGFVNYGSIPYTTDSSVSEWGGSGNQSPWGYAGGGLVHLGNGSFVVDARTVSELGNGSSSAGQELLAKLGGQPIHGPGDGVSDSIHANIGGTQQARVARDEVHFEPAAVAHLGGGDVNKGSKMLYSLMAKARKARIEAAKKDGGRGVDTGLRALVGVK